MSFTKPNRR